MWGGGETVNIIAFFMHSFYSLICPQRISDFLARDPKEIFLHQHKSRVNEKIKLNFFWVMKDKYFLFVEKQVGPQT